MLLIRMWSMDPASHELAGHNSCWSNASLNLLEIMKCLLRTYFYTEAPIQLYSRKAITFVNTQIPNQIPVPSLRSLESLSRMFKSPPLYSGGTAIYLVHNEGGQNAPPQNMPLWHWIILQEGKWKTADTRGILCSPPFCPRAGHKFPFVKTFVSSLPYQKENNPCHRKKKDGTEVTAQTNLLKEPLLYSSSFPSISTFPQYHP